MYIPGKCYALLVWRSLAHYSEIFFIEQFYLGNPVPLSDNLVSLKFNENSSRQFHLSCSLITYNNLLQLSVVRSVSEFLKVQLSLCASILLIATLTTKSSKLQPSMKGRTFTKRYHS